MSSRAQAITLAVAAQIALLLAALTIGILQPEEQPDHRFEAAPREGPEDAVRERQQQLQEFQQWSSSARQIQTLASDALLADSLPPVDLPDPAVAPSEAMTGWESLSPAGLARAAGIWDTHAATGSASSVDLFGLQTEATRILIAFDISASVKTKVERAGYRMHSIRDRTWENLESMNANTLFGLLQFSRAGDTFADQLRPATRRHLDAARSWLHDSFRTDGSSGSGWKRGQPDGIEFILGKAFAFDPRLDTLILISDGDFYRTTARGGSEKVPWSRITERTRELQATLEQPCSIHFIAFELPAEHRGSAREWVRRNNGTLVEVGAE